MAVSDIFVPQTFQQLASNITNVITGDATQTVSTAEGAVMLAVARAAAANDMFIQSQVAQVALNNNLLTATGTNLDTFVNQFCPPFTPRVGATAATSGALAPTTLVAAAASTYLLVTNATGLLVGQALALAQGANTATTTIATIQPTTYLGAYATGSVVIGGTPHTGDVVTVTINGTAVTYTVQGGDTLATIAAAVKVAINASAPITALVLASNTGGSATVTLQGAVPGTTGNVTLTTGVTGAGATTTSTASGANLTGGAAADVSQGATTLTLGSTVGMFAGGTLSLQDGNYTATAVIQSVTDGTHVLVQAVGMQVLHTFATATTVVTLLNVLQVAALTITGGTLGGLTAGTTVTATSLLQGARFFRVNAAPTTPTIPAQTNSQAGYVIQTKLGSMQYVVVPDATNANYNPVTGLYTMPANATSVNVTVQAVTPGLASNIIAGTLTVMPTAILGIDGVTNDYAISNGTDPETDAALVARFQAFISSLSNATVTAIGAAVAATQAGMQYKIIENVASDGVTTQPGNFVVVASDATGNLGTALYNLIYAAVNNSRPLCSTFQVKAPTLVSPTIAMTLVYQAGIQNITAVRTAVQTAIFNYLTNSASGATLVFHVLEELALNTPGVADIVACTINGNGYSSMSPYTTAGTGPANLTVAPLQLIRPPVSNIVIL